MKGTQVPGPKLSGLECSGLKCWDPPSWDQNEGTRILGPKCQEFVQIKFVFSLESQKFSFEVSDFKLRNLMLRSGDAIFGKIKQKIIFAFEVRDHNMHFLTFQ